MTNGIISQSVLVESLSARNEALENFSDERSLEILNKAKAVFLAVWNSSAYATVEQVAEYYGVGDEAVRSIIRRNESELRQDGAKKLTGKELRSASVGLTRASKTSQMWVFTPRAFLRTGFILTQSEVAAEVRTQALNLIEVVPAQAKEIVEKSDRLRELELENENLKLQVVVATNQNQANQAALASKQLDNTMLNLHGLATVLAVRGQRDQIVRVPVKTTEVIDEKTGAKFSGMTLPQLKDYILANHGIKFNSGAKIEQFLHSIKRHDLLAQMKRPVLQTYVPEEFIDEVIDVLTDGATQQLLIGL